MKLFIKFLFVFTLVIGPLTHADQDDDNEGTHACSSIKPSNMSDRLFESIFGKFEKVLTKCCEKTVTDDCDNAQIALVCKMNVNRSGGSCPEQCKQWADACRETDIGAQKLRRLFEDSPNSRNDY